MSVRRTTSSDRDALHELYAEFFAEWPPPPYYGVELEAELAEVDEMLEGELAFIAERDGEAVGFALARRKEGTWGLLSDIYVRPAARRLGLATELAGAVAQALRETGVTHVVLSVDMKNRIAQAAYERWGFRAQTLTLAAEIDELSAGLADREKGLSFGSVHVQTDDAGAVVRAVRQYVPRLPGASEGTVVSPPRQGWVAVYDELCDREPDLLKRLARELSDRMGAVTLAIGLERGEVVHYLLYERGRMVDEYLSTPTYYGELPPGDAVALGANATVVARLTGADPKEVRSVAQTASTPGELPPGPQLLAAIARAMGIEGAGHSYAEAAELPGSERIGAD